VCGKSPFGDALQTLNAGSRRAFRSQVSFQAMPKKASQEMRKMPVVVITVVIAS
jgi:hypothetical protein